MQYNYGFQKFRFTGWLSSFQACNAVMRPSYIANTFADQRGELRYVFHRKGHLTDGVGNKHSIKIVDISTTGIGLISLNPIQPGQRCFLNFPTLHLERPELALNGTVVYNILSGMNGYRVGIEFANLDPMTRSFIDQIIAKTP